MAWSVEQVPSLHGKTILVTGATSGIGFHAARTFAQKGAKVILASLHQDEVTDAAKEILEEIPDADLVELQVDLSDLESVRDSVKRFESTGVEKLDVLLLNAGVVSTTYQRSRQGVERTFATNHLGHWLLTGMLLKFMRNVPESRIIAVSSLMHRRVDAIDYRLLTGETKEGFTAIKVYAQTKFANHLFVAGLNRRLQRAGAKTIAVAAHPGIASTPLYDSCEYVAFCVKAFIWTVFMKPEGGSKPLVMAATDPDIGIECYYGPRGFMQGRGRPHSGATRNPNVNNEKSQEELWHVSERLCNFSYDI